MSLSVHERQEAESAVTTAYDALTDLMDIARDGGDEELERIAERLQSQVNDLYRRLA